MSDFTLAVKLIGLHVGVVNDPNIRIEDDLAANVQSECGVEVEGVECGVESALCE